MYVPSRSLLLASATSYFQPKYVWHLTHETCATVTEGPGTAQGRHWCGVVWCGVVWCGVVWCGVVWCGVVWCGVVWCGVVWCGVVCRPRTRRAGPYVATGHYMSHRPIVLLCNLIWLGLEVWASWFWAVSPGHAAPWTEFGSWRTCSTLGHAALGWRGEGGRVSCRSGRDKGQGIPRAARTVLS